MGEIAGVVRVAHSDRDGTGLEVWEAMDPDSLVSGSPVQRGAFCDENAQTGYMAGVWDCTAFVDQPGPYTVDEFMLLLEGSVIMGLPDGSEVTVGAGEVFCIPKGLHCQWKMPGYVRKVFMIVDDPVAEGSENPSLSRVTVPDLAPAPEAGPVATTRRWFENSTGRMSVSVTTHAGGSAAATANASHELIHVLEGTLTLTSGAASMRIGTGETVYLKAGTAARRSTAPGTRTVEALYRP